MYDPSASQVEWLVSMVETVKNENIDAKILVSAHSVKAKLNFPSSSNLLVRETEEYLSFDENVANLALSVDTDYWALLAVDDFLETTSFSAITREITADGSSAAVYV